MPKDGVRPGIHPNCDISNFSPDEQSIIDVFKTIWYVTGAKCFNIAASSYRCLVARPTSLYQEAFNLSREFLIVFSPYETFEPRSIDAINFAYSLYPNLRLEEICSLLISKDNAIEVKIVDILKSNQESQVIIPFSYSEIINNTSDTNYIYNRFRKAFYARDLFAFESPLRKDLYFFGRADVVNTLVNRHLSHENSGIFGLRKTGKTSILYSVQRALDRKKGASLWLDCEVLHVKRWNQALYYISNELKAKYNVKRKYSETDYEESKTFELFEEDMLSIYHSIGKNAVLLILDEIEHITFDISISTHWKHGVDFVKFWQVLRALFQKNPNLFSYLIAGTNPMCVEITSIHGVDNPIYSQIPLDSYVKQFNFEQTREMVKKLGGYMGLDFDDLVCASLTQDYGGHPFLIRHVCSVVNKLLESQERPATVNRTIYQKAKSIFDRERGNQYSEMILEVLKRYYEDEYVMLTALSIGDMNFFDSFAHDSPAYTNHLLGYGILEKTGNIFDFKIDILRQYLADKTKYKKLNMSNEEKQREISERRNMLEPKLRKIIQNQLKVRFAEDQAKKILLGKWDTAKKRKYSTLKYKELFDPNKHEIYLEDLRNIMVKHWEECFRNIFDTDVEKFNSRMILINLTRKGDAHASQINDSDMESFRGAMSWLEEKVAEFLD